MDKLKMISMDNVQENIKKIQQLFPNAVTEVLRDGKPTLAIDFDILKQEMSGTLIDDKEERYQFTWPDKKKSILLANSPISATLRPCKEESVDFDNTQNLYIEGDNLDVLKLLQETYLGKIKMIYIDPPYNTGNDFVYNDDFAENADDYIANSGQYDDQGNRLVQNTESNGRFHTDWLNMIYPRLKVAKDLLSDDGVIFISIDDNEVNNLLKICYEIFGENNFVAQFPWQSRQSIQNDTDISINHEYVIAFAKHRRMENRRLKETNISEWYRHDSFVFLPIPLDKEKFDNPDNDPRGLWKADPMDAPHVRPNLTYPITNPNTGVQHLPAAGRHWRILPDKFASALADGRIVWGKDGTGRPQMKVFYEEKKMYGSVDNSWWTGERFGTATQGTKELIQLFGGKTPFDTPKPTKLLYSVLKMVSKTTDNDIILDFYSGSATTAHAVMQLNAEDGGKRKFIMVQLPEKCDEKSEAFKAGYKNICEIGKERIRRAGMHIVEAQASLINAAKSGAFEQGAVFAEWTSSESALKTQAAVRKQLDVGFRVLKLDSSNMKDVYYKSNAYTQDLLSMLEDNIKEDRSPLDLLFQVMLELGKPLSAKIEEKEIAGKHVFIVDENDLIACFDKNVTEEVVKAIAQLKPLYAVFRDSSLENDSANANLDQIFATYSPNTTRKVL